jgi:hypothetical protein
MQKVEGSNPFSRSPGSPRTDRFVHLRAYRDGGYADDGRIEVGSL